MVKELKCYRCTRPILRKSVKKDLCAYCKKEIGLIKSEPLPSIFFGNRRIL